MENRLTRDLYKLDYIQWLDVSGLKDGGIKAAHSPQRRRDSTAADFGIKQPLLDAGAVGL